MSELIDAASARDVIALLTIELRTHAIAGCRKPPPEPTTCCGRGCNGCVWESYFAAVGWWREDATALLAASTAHVPG